jgi:hypothetical protein
MLALIITGRLLRSTPSLLLTSWSCMLLITTYLHSHHFDLCAKFLTASPKYLSSSLYACVILFHPACAFPRNNPLFTHIYELTWFQISNYLSCKRTFAARKSCHLHNQPKKLPRHVGVSCFVRKEGYYAVDKSHRSKII